MLLTAEIESYLQHHEFSLATRRLLDACYDTQKSELIQNGIDACKAFRTTHNKDSFAESATALAQAVEKLETTRKAESSLVHAEGIGKTYATGHFSLKPLNVTVNTQDVIGLVGENGNGKTTLLNILCGNLKYDEGAITYSDVPAKDYYKIKNYVAFIPQRIPRWFGLLKDNLHFSASISGYSGKQNDLMVDFVLERFYLSDYAHLTWNQISSGYRTRFEIARILLQNPKLLILDEPLANLDINAQGNLLTDLRLLAKSRNMGVILSSQQLHEVEKVADVVHVLKQGKLIHSQQLHGQQETKSNKTILELETTQTREQLQVVVGNEVQINFTGSYFVLETETMKIEELIFLLASKQISITYLRDISNSTKQFFQNF
jgi:ABC-2 type transport system ATP-binding protein